MVEILICKKCKQVATLIITEYDMAGGEAYAEYSCEVSCENNQEEVRLDIATKLLLT